MKKIASFIEHTEYKMYKKHQHKVSLNGMKEAPACSDRVPFEVGDIVTYTNDYGVKFKQCRIIGFWHPRFLSNGNLDRSEVYLDKSSYWAPVPAASLKLEL